uniref:Uncharacterized protein n=1 Tax=Zea mays TaxID=4577 RepID=B6UFG0_MAIZE|nr:hypothetical protein [Zea mays]
MVKEPRHMMVINTSSSRLLLTLLLLEFAAVAVPAMASTVVAGMVFCDQCKDGARGLFDYPLYGARVAIQCGGGCNVCGSGFRQTGTASTSKSAPRKKAVS